jgi:hypothetical protein
MLGSREATLLHMPKKDALSKSWCCTNKGNVTRVQ